MNEEVPAFAPPDRCTKPYTVSQINDIIASIIESGNTIVWVEAEVSNFKCASSGHWYFTLRDEQSQIPAVMWRSYVQKTRVKIEDGMKISVIAVVRVYRKGGYYQLDVMRIQPAGRGVLWAAFEALKEKLQQEGLFDMARKKPLPETVKTLGIITSLRGAAVRDIIKVVASRAPQTDIVIIDVPVQGEGAAEAMAQAIKDMNTWGKVDCIIVGRGGGSFEDLWEFNKEVLARAIASSTIPIISAVGHEIDVTIADFVADVRAPTPSAAAEIAVADTQELRRYFTNLAERFGVDSIRYFRRIRDDFYRLALSSSFSIPQKLITEMRQYVDELGQRNERAFATMIKNRRLWLSRLSAQLSALSPLGVLSRGYSIVSDKKGKIIRDSSSVVANDTVFLRFHKGSATANVVEVDTINNLNNKNLS